LDGEPCLDPAVLVREHQDWIYNLVIRMAGNREDACDATQEILIRAITHLHTFKGHSSVKTWLYRIAANHTLNMVMRQRDVVTDSFHELFESVTCAEDSDLIPGGDQTADQTFLFEETKLACMVATLRCLDRRQRLVFILGGIFAENARIGAAVLDMSPANFRQILSRARKKMEAFMGEHCSLVRTGNRCRCDRMSVASIRKGYLDPQKRRYVAPDAPTLKAVIRGDVEEIQ